MLVITSASARRSLRPISGPATPVASASHSECDCAAHRAVSQRHPTHGGRSSWVSLILPLVVCAFCPACLALWAPLLASLGLGFALPDAVHPIGLGVAVLVALLPATRRARRTELWRPLLFVVAGAAGLLASHALGESRLIEVLGALSLVIGSVMERRASSAVRPSNGAPV